MGLIDREALQNYIDEMPEVSEKEIRAKAIDECIRIIEETPWKDTDMLVEELKQLKGNEFFNFDSPVVRIDEKSYNKAIDEVMEIVKKAYHNFSGYDLEFMTKYGNKNASQQAESYSTMMMYEIAGEFDDLIDNLEQLKGAEENG